MSILLNLAGSGAGDPILKALALKWILAASSADIATLSDAWIDQAAGFPGTNSVKSGLSPAATVIASGVSGTYSDTTKQYSIGSTTGLSVGDYYYLNHASLTPGLFEIATIASSTSVTIVANPLNGLGDKTGISYQVAWRSAQVAGTSPLLSSGPGQINYFKVRASDSAANQTDYSDSAYVRDPPSGANFISIGGQSYLSGGQVNTTTPAFDLLAAWTNRGGVSHVALANHSVQGVNNFRFGDNTTAEKALAAALSGGWLLVGGDGMKYGQLQLRSKSGGTSYSVDMEIRLDTVGPLITTSLYGA